METTLWRFESQAAKVKATKATQETTVLDARQDCSTQNAPRSRQAVVWKDCEVDGTITTARYLCRVRMACPGKKVRAESARRTPGPKCRGLRVSARSRVTAITLGVPLPGVTGRGYGVASAG